MTPAATLSVDAGLTSGLFPPLQAMRFLAGFFGSPALATGGATLADMYKPQHIAYSLGIWGCAAVCGPTMGPLLGGFVFREFALC